MTDAASPPSPDRTPPIPAATLVVMRDRADGPPELLMVERSAAMRFAGGALVFPGGRVDPGDRALADTLGWAGEEGAARVAAIRETIEEAGIAIGLDPVPDAAQVAALRAQLLAEVPIGGAVEAVMGGGVRFDADALVPFARWLPRGVTHRVFDTFFFLARLPADAPPPIVDATENVRLFWMGAADVLAECAAGRATVIFPTRRNLERLALYADFDQAVADAARHPVRTITPWIEERDGQAMLCIPEDLGYPVTAQALSDAQRA